MRDLAAHESSRHPGDALSGSREWVVAARAVPSLRVEVDRVSRTLKRSGGQPLTLIQTGLVRGGLARVRFSGDTATLGNWEIVAVLHHQAEEVRVEPCVPLGRAQLDRLGEARALCEVCRTVRPRTRTWILRDRASGHTKQVGSSCLKPLTGAVSIETALLRARALADLSARLSQAAKHADRERFDPGEPYIDTNTFLAQTVVVIKEQGWRPASEADPTWGQALERVERGVEPEPANLRRAREIRDWAASPANGADEYRARLRDCLAHARLSSRELPLAASGVRTYNRHLYWAIRRSRASSSLGVRSSGTGR